MTSQSSGYSSFPTDPVITAVTGRFAGGASLVRPDTTSSSPLVGPNFQFDLTSVPEPGTALFGLALSGVALVRPRR